MVQVSVDQLTKRFASPAGRPPTVAVDNISLRIASGDLFFLLGPSGCGKTTLLRMIAGFVLPDSGRILFEDRDMSQVPPYLRDTGMVFQSYALWPHMTVGDNIGFGLDVRKVKGPDRARRIDEALSMVQMAHLKDRKPAQLSGGQQQRVALARALAVRPQCLLLDEPLSNLDAKLRLEMRSEIRQIVKQTGITAIYVTHDQKEALSMADFIAVMRDGKLEQAGTPADLYRRPVSQFVAGFLGESNFLSGTVESANNTILTIKTSAGPMLAAVIKDRTYRAGEQVCVAFRPEAVTFGASAGVGGGANMNRLRGRRIATTYLGEMAEHLIELPGHVQVKGYEINPRESASGAGDVTLSVDAGNVMLVAPEPVQVRAAG